MIFAEPARAAGKTIVFYDPDASYEAIPRVVENLNLHFSTALPGFTLTVTSDIENLIATVNSSKAPYAIVASESLGRVQALGATPLLVPEAKQSVYYTKILVDRGKGSPGDLSNKRIAAATGDRRPETSARLLLNLKNAGLLVEKTLVLSTSKDLDALLAVIFGQADAALVTSFSLQTLKTVNPAAAAMMRDVWHSGNILRPVLVAIKSYEDPSLRDTVVKAFTTLNDTSPGKNAMEAFGVDRWIEFLPEHMSAAGGRR